MKTAFINEIQEKQTSVGKMYDFVFSNGDKVGAGKFPPKGFAAGDYVQYDVTMKGQYMNLAPGSMSKSSAPAGVQAPSSKPGFVASVDNRQEVISKQAALNSALAFVSLLVAADAIPVAKSAKTDKKADALNDIVSHYTRQYYKQSTGNELPEAESTTSGGGLAEAEADGNWNE